MVSGPAEGAVNMALDEALMRRAGRTGDAVFRVYGWAAPTLSLGRNQRARGCYDLDAAATHGVGIVRRPTGGRALLHHREITYSATLPCDGPDAARSSYAFINDVLIAGLRRLGVRAERARGSATVAMPPGLRPCFDAPAEHEIVVGARKLVGSAQWRQDGALLQHGSILVRDDQSLIATLLLGGNPPPASAATLHETLGRDPGIDEVAGVLRGALEAATLAPPVSLAEDDALGADVAALRATYADDAWTWRR